MGQLERMRENRNGGKKAPKVTEIKGKPIFTFHPTKEQAEAIRSDGRPLEEVISELAARLEGGLRIIISSASNRDSFSVLVKESEPDWQEALAVSVWHSDLVIALRGIETYLNKVNPDWPDTPAATQLSFTDW